MRRRRDPGAAVAGVALMALRVRMAWRHMWQLVYAGLAGGRKGVPESVAEHL